MSAKPLTELISGRGFDKSQPGLSSRFAAYRFGHKLTYCEPTDDPAMRLDFETPLHLGRVTAWESGACDLVAVEISTGRTVFQEHHQLRSEDEFHHLLPRLVLFMRDAAGRPQRPA
jgi:hypothetical protein